MKEVTTAQGRADRADRQITARQIREAIPPTERPFVSEDEAAAIRGVSKWTFRQWKKKGYISPVRLPEGCRRSIYRTSEVLALFGGV